MPGSEQRIPADAVVIAFGFRPSPPGCGGCLIIVFLFVLVTGGAPALINLLGFLFFYFTEGRLMESIPGKEIVKSLLIGGFFGFFITNSPCARGRC